MVFDPAGGHEVGIADGHNEPMRAEHVIATHGNTDFDAFASMLAARFLRELAEGAGLTLHVRLIEGQDTQHVLDAIFKTLGVALAQACSPRRRRGERDG